MVEWGVLVHTSSLMLKLHVDGTCIQCREQKAIAAAALHHHVENRQHVCVPRSAYNQPHAPHHHLGTLV